MTKSARGGEPEFIPLTAEQLRGADANVAARKFDRKTPAGGRVGALESLHEALVDDALLYSGSLQNQRDAVVHSMQAVLAYLAEQGFAGPTLEPLNRPVLALVERESNRLDPLFERRRGGAPKRSMATEHRSGAMAALAEAWLNLRAGSDQKFTGKFRALARELTGAFFGAVTYSNIRSARELVSQEGQDHLAVRWAGFYREQLDQASAKLGVGNAFIVVLRNLNRTEGPPEQRDWRT